MSSVTEIFIHVRVSPILERTESIVVTTRENHVKKRIKAVLLITSSTTGFRAIARQLIPGSRELKIED